jgi:lipopolysaccharide biosynthesis glycosyltransferase
LRNGIYDIPSNAPASTDFAISRFLVPIIHQSGWCLFADCDVVFLADVDGLMQIADSKYAVMVVKHEMPDTGNTKMDGQPQTQYSRKNWSSVILWNCDHPANKRLSLVDVNERPGRDLHGFYWLHHSEIGELPVGWNWLVNVQPKPKDLKIAHFTLGGPWFANWEPQPHDDIWLDALN